MAATFFLVQGIGVHSPESPPPGLGKLQFPMVITISFRKIFFLFFFANTDTKRSFTVNNHLLKYRVYSQLPSPPIGRILYMSFLDLRTEPQARAMQLDFSFVEKRCVRILIMIDFLI